MNHVAIHDILESDFNAPLTYETLKELGFKKVFNTEGKYHTTYWRLVILKDIMLETYEVKSDKEAGETAWLKTPSQVPQTHYKTVGSVRMLIEALKGDE